MSGRPSSLVRLLGLLFVAGPLFAVAESDSTAVQAISFVALLAVLVGLLVVSYRTLSRDPSTAVPDANR